MSRRVIVIGGILVLAVVAVVVVVVLSGDEDTEVKEVPTAPDDLGHFKSTHTEQLQAALAQAEKSLAETEEQLDEAADEKQRSQLQRRQKLLALSVERLRDKLNE